MVRSGGYGVADGAPRASPTASSTDRTAITPEVPGSYLAANVISRRFFQRPYQTAFTADLPAEQAEYLQQTAQRSVLDNLVLLNIR